MDTIHINHYAKQPSIASMKAKKYDNYNFISHVFEIIIDLQDNHTNYKPLVFQFGYYLFIDHYIDINGATTKINFDIINPDHKTHEHYFSTIIKSKKQKNNLSFFIDIQQEKIVAKKLSNLQVSLNNIANIENYVSPLVEQTITDTVNIFKKHNVSQHKNELDIFFQKFKQFYIEELKHNFKNEYISLYQDYIDRVILLDNTADINTQFKQKKIKL